MGKMIKPLLKKPDVVYSSAATRAITTALAICFEIDFPASKIEIEYALYVASEQKVINKILSLNDALNNVMLVGHNEWMEDVANYFKANFGHMPTGGCLGLRFNCDSWTQASRENCTLAFFEFPKKYLSNLKIDRKPDDL